MSNSFERDLKDTMHRMPLPNYSGASVSDAVDEKEAQVTDSMAQIIVELREQAHEYRQADTSVGMFADHQTADMCDDFANRLEALSRAQASQGRNKPNADCSGDPSNCPDNEGYGCACGSPVSSAVDEVPPLPIPYYPQWSHSNEFAAFTAEQMREYARLALSRAQAAPVQQAPAVSGKKMSITEAREFLVAFMERHFTDKTFHHYIRGDRGENRLAGDFAWQMARALLSQPVAAPVSEQAKAKPDAFDILLLQAGLRSGDKGAFELAAQLAGFPPCEKCGYVKQHCQCTPSNHQGGDKS